MTEEQYQGTIDTHQAFKQMFDTVKEQIDDQVNVLKEQQSRAAAELLKAAEALEMHGPPEAHSLTDIVAEQAANAARQLSELQQHIADMEANVDLTPPPLIVIDNPNAIDNPIVIDNPKE